jgi:methylthioribose-1-phosphate isomerase
MTDAEKGDAALFTTLRWMGGADGFLRLIDQTRLPAETVEIDCRDIDDIQLYVDGVNVLPSEEFKLGDATGPMKLLVHMEKTSNDTTADLRVDFARIRATDLAT